MKQHVLISGASIAGLTLAYWLNKYGYKVTLVEISDGLRRGGSPIDVREEALEVAEEMGILEEIKRNEFVHTDKIVNAKNETLVSFSFNDQAEYEGDIEIHRDDLVDILYENISQKSVEFLFENRIVGVTQHEDSIDVTFKNDESRNFDFVFGADGVHSGVRKLVFGEEENYSKFFGAYFAIAEAPNLKPESTNMMVMYQEIGKRAVLVSFKNTAGAALFFRSPKVVYDYKNQKQQKNILKAHFKNNTSWKIPEILDAMLQSDNLYLDEVCQIHMPSWSHERVALVGDAAYAASFPTGMGTSLAMQGATLLAKSIKSSDDYKTAFTEYYETFQPYVESIQAKITRSLNWWLPETEEGLQEAINKFKD